MTEAAGKPHIPPQYGSRSRRIMWIALAVSGLFLLLHPAGLQAQENLPHLSLEQAYANALKQHPSLVRAQAQVNAAGARARQAEAGMLPTVTLQGTATDGPLGAPAFGPLGNPAFYGAPPLSVQGMAGDPVKKQFGGGLNITQTLLDFGRTQHLVAARRELMRAAEEDANTQKALLLLNVRQAYLNVLRARQTAEAQQENVRRRDATVLQAKAFVEGQLKSGVDLQLAEANAAEANVALVAAQNETRYAFAELNSAMGDTKMALYQLDADPGAGLTAVAGAPASVEEAMQRALMQRPERKAAARQILSADQTLRGVRSELMPRLDAVASLGVVNPSGVIHNSKDYAVGVALSIPLYTGGLVEGRIAEEKQKREAAQAQEQELQEAIKLQVARAWLDVQTKEAQIKAAQAQVVSADSSVQLASERYRLQLNTIVELTEAEALSARARVQLANARYDLESARAVLDWAMGETYSRYAGPPRKR